MGDANTTKRVGFFKGVRNEFKKIVWPSFPVLTKQSVTVIIVSLIIGGIVAGIDALYGTIVRLLLS